MLQSEKIRQGAIFGSTGSTNPPGSTTSHIMPVPPEKAFTIGFTGYALGDAAKKPIDVTLGPQNPQYVFEMGEFAELAVGYTGPCWQNGVSKMKISCASGAIFSSKPLAHAGRWDGQPGSSPTIFTATVPGTSTVVYYVDPIYWFKLDRTATFYCQLGPGLQGNVFVTGSAIPMCNSANVTHSPYNAGSTEYGGGATATSFSLRIEAWEKPWGGIWGAAEDQGTNDFPIGNGVLKRPWYHLWRENENAVRVRVLPERFERSVTKVTYPTLPVADFAPGEGPANLLGGSFTLPSGMNWKKVTGPVGTHLDEKPTVTIEGSGTTIQLTGKLATTDLVMNEINEVEWVERELFGKEDVPNGSGSTTPLYLAELVKGNGGGEYHFTNQPNSYAVFPTFAGQRQEHFEQAKVMVTLKEAIPEHMHGTVHLRCFDPKNVSPRDTSKWSLNNPADNRGGVPLGNQTLKLTQMDSPAQNTTPQKYTIATFTEGFGDNFIVAAHPNSGVTNKYKFDNAGQILLKPDSQTLPDSLRTSILYNAAWNGFKVPKTWEVIDTGNTIHIATAIDDINHGESYAKSVLNKTDFTKDMELELKYCFARSRDNIGSTWGYVLPPKQESKPKLSFVGNSGVKIGSTGGASTGVYEIAILDMDSMIAMGGYDSTQLINNVTPVYGTIDNFRRDRPVTGAGVQDNRRVEGMKATYGTPPAHKTLAFEPENVNTLMHGVAYGKDYNNMNDYTTASATAPGGTGAAWEKYWNTLRNNQINCGTLGNDFTMVIGWTPQSNKLTAKINGSERYGEAGFNDFKDEHLYLQSHWGSGVVFTSARFVPGN